MLAPVAALLGVLGVVIALDDEPPPADLVFVNRSEVFTLDPQRMSWIQDLRMAYALYEGLVRWNNDDFSIVPAAAHWTTSADGLTYTFTIRPDARWSNGDPLTASDFIYAWRRAILPDTAADYTSMFFVIEGAEAFFPPGSRRTARARYRWATSLRLQRREERALRESERYQRRMPRLHVASWLVVSTDRTACE